MDIKFFLGSLIVLLSYVSCGCMEPNSLGYVPTAQSIPRLDSVQIISGNQKNPQLSPQSTLNMIQMLQATVGTLQQENLELKIRIKELINNRE